MNYYVGKDADKIALRHYGVIGMKWGVRRYQNADGTLTEAGKMRYGEDGQHRYTSMWTKIERRGVEAAKRRNSNQYKIDKLTKRAEKSQELDDRMLDYAKRVSGGKNIATRILTGGLVGGKPYQTILAAMNGHMDKGITGKKVAAALLSTFGYSEIIARELYVGDAGSKVKEKAKSHLND